MDDVYPDGYPVDAARGLALLTAYGAQTEGHTLTGDAQRIMSDLAAVLLSDDPSTDFADIARRALARLGADNG